MITNVPEFRLRCPRCNGSQLIEVRKYLASLEPLAFIRCEVETCGWEAVAMHGAPEAAKAGQAVYQRDLDDRLATQRAADAASNTARQAEAQRARLAQAEASIRTWATGPVGNRVVRAGAGWEVREPELSPGVSLSDLDAAVRSVYAAAVSEAEGEARQRDLADAETLAKARAEQPKLWADQAQREQAEARRRRAERSDVEVSHPT